MASPSQADVSTDSGEVTDPENSTECPKNDVQINAVPACVTWNDGDSRQARSICHSAHDHLHFHAQHDTSSDTAFFQVRTNVALKARKDKTNVFLSIYPERIQSVAVVASDGADSAASAQLGTSAYCLLFTLSMPPALIVPKGDLTPKQRSSGLLLDCLRGLAEQTTFKLHLPTTALSKVQLESLCKAASSGALSSMEKLKDVASLYGGKGGRIIQHEPQAAVASQTASATAVPETEGLPSYDDLGFENDSPRPYTTQKSGTKRRRASSGAERSGTPSSHKCVSLDVQTICSKMIERIDQGFGQLHSRMDRMEARLTDLERCVHSRAEKLEQSIVNSQQHSSEQADELRDELEKGLYDVRKETEDIITVRVEDDVYTARQDLDDHVRDEMAEVEERIEERIMQRLSNASMSLEFNWSRE
ncbi:hypothetical protein LA080_012493 [Diaporthe eres]|uniref:Uncharacterized protein n=1 Tax=Diaporthe vaccinii TaxID=105482 RepID=A0ABR4DTU9_9PEZI|nr:hypothetical protein LA080_012493 [Diaporthe eres]